MIKKSVLLTALAIAGFAVTSLAQTVPNYVPTNGLVGWWPFNGNAIDESINTNDGTVNGAALTADRFGNANSAYSFDGLNDNIIIQNNPQINPTSITISGWINNATNATNTQNGAKGIITKWYQQGNCNNNSDNYTVMLSYVNNSSLLLNATLINSSSSTALNSINNVVGVNSWKFFTFVHDATMGQKIYIDGVLINSNNITGTLCYTTNNLIFGADNQFGTLWRFFNGKLDDIGIWNRALTPTEITGLYNGNLCFQTITVTDTLLININITGFSPVTYQNTIKIWPNPTNDHITIDNGNLANLTGHQIKISNALGQQVFQSAITQQQFYVNMSTWGGNGIYFVNLINAQGVTIETRKIVLQ
jgi:hypothetical protein